MGSNPVGGTKIYSSVAQLVERLPVKQVVGGSSPSRGASNTLKEGRYAMKKVFSFRIDEEIINMVRERAKANKLSLNGMIEKLLDRAIKLDILDPQTQ